MVAYYDWTWSVSVYYSSYLCGEPPPFLLTCFCRYFYITWGIWLRHCLNGRQDEYELVWPSTFTSIPFVVKRDKGGAKDKKSLSNGNVKRA